MYRNSSLVFLLSSVLLLTSQAWAGSNNTCFIIDNDKGFNHVSYAFSYADKTTTIRPNSNNQAIVSIPVNDDGTPVVISLSAKADGDECSATQPRDKKFHKDTLYYYHLNPSHSSGGCKLNLKIHLHENCSELSSSLPINIDTHSRRNIT